MLSSTSCLAILLIPFAPLLAHRGRAREATAAVLLLVAFQELPLAEGYNPLEVMGEVLPAPLGLSVNLAE